MAGFKDTAGNYVKGIEDYIPKIQYKTEEHKDKVVEDIKVNWKCLSHNKNFMEFLQPVVLLRQFSITEK